MSEPPRFKIPPPQPPQVSMPSILDQVQQFADQVRAAHKLDPRPGSGWRVVLPGWIIAQVGGWDAFVEQFEASYERRPEMAALGVIGFETATWAGMSSRQYTLRRYRKEDE